MTKLAMKLKIQMAREEEEEEEIAGGKKSYICPYCQKEFSNGKVYGGHKRSHSMKNKKKGHFQEKIRFPNSKNHVEAVEDLVPDDNQCPLCDKKFPSDKSLFGHMRKHSERAWRGMKRPHALQEISSSSTVSLEKDDEQIDSADGEKGFALDLSKALPGWSKTGKRGRKGKGPMRCPPVVEQQTMSHDGASNLLALADAEPAQQSLPPKKRKLDFSALGGMNNSPAEKLKGINGSPSMSKNQWNEVPENDSGKGKALAILVSDDDDDNKMHTPITSHKHVCSICDKSFKSYQALGGHKAHHGRKYDIDSSPSTDDGSSSADDDLLALSDEQPQTPPYQCPFCSKTFSKGQALGGHKRHCKGTALVNEASHAALRQMLSFDLNEPPPAENEERKVAGAVTDAQETISLPWHEDGAEHDTYSSNSPSS